MKAPRFEGRNGLCLPRGRKARGRKALRPYRRMSRSAASAVANWNR